MLLKVQMLEKRCLSLEEELGNLKQEFQRKLHEIKEKHDAESKFLFPFLFPSFVKVKSCTQAKGKSLHQSDDFETRKKKLKV